MYQISTGSNCFCIPTSNIILYFIIKKTTLNVITSDSINRVKPNDRLNRDE